MRTQVVETYKQAVKAATASYWVERIQFHPLAEKDEEKFDRRYRVADRSESGLIHYAKK